MPCNQKNADKEGKKKIGAIRNWVAECAHEPGWIVCVYKHRAWVPKGKDIQGNAGKRCNAKKPCPMTFGSKNTDKQKKISEVMKKSEISFGSAYRAPKTFFWINSQKRCDAENSYKESHGDKQGRELGKIPPRLKE